METTQAVSLILYSAGVVFYALSQACAHGKIKDDPDAKYAKPKIPGIGLYYLVFGITYKERFPLSATLLVSLVDKYHRFQLAHKLCIIFALVSYRNMWGIWDALILFCLWGLVFTISYRLASA